MTQVRQIKLQDSLPCADCGKDAYRASARPMGAPAAGEWALTPICSECDRKRLAAVMAGQSSPRQRDGEDKGSIA